MIRPVTPNGYAAPKHPASGPPLVRRSKPVVALAWAMIGAACLGPSAALATPQHAPPDLVATSRAVDDPIGTTGRAAAESASSSVTARAPHWGAATAMATRVAAAAGFPPALTDGLTDTAAFEEVLLAPRCPATRLEAVSELANPDESMATLRRHSTEGRRTLRVGGSLGGYRVAHIGDNRALGIPSVWLWDGSGLCQVPLSRAHLGPTLPTAAEPVASMPTPRSDTRADLAQRVDDAVVYRGGNHRAVRREIVRDVLEHVGELGVNRRWVGADDGSAGWRLEFASGSVLDSLGLQSGDRLLQVNGMTLKSPTEVLHAYMRLREALQLDVDVFRQGERHRLTISIE